MSNQNKYWFNPESHTGWKKSQSAETRRKHLISSVPKNEPLHQRRVTAGRKALALSNVTTDPLTKRLAKADSEYFFSLADCISCNPLSQNVSMDECTQDGWIYVNGGYYDWYYQNYPVLVDKGVTLPVDYDLLGIFYVTDMQDRNLEPLDSYINCYKYLFEYFIGRISGAIKVEGKTFLGYTWENLPKAFDKTFTQLTNPFGIPWWVYLLGGLAAYTMLKR